ncbi:CRISPR-associated protein Csx11 [Persephonella atlantica]|uniref:CRISPR-associated protein Csx11 n=1 Tax=Persephonella atlantica TaxID=2699429 RepID=A0ABS1GGC2_9AQUI|nr:CRISPR-associated protein Csx11 [Persephonella atlantica]MBK3331983.1 CRISPR-associated protein Csx11 [Persephonella atlantica]
MSGLEKLKQYRDEILKAEIGALLFNLGKTHIGFWEKRNGKTYFNIDNNSFKNIFGYGPFGDYRNYYQKHDDLKDRSPFEYELEKYGLKDFIFNRILSFPFKVLIKNGDRKEEREKIEWHEIFKGDALEIEFIKRIFFRGCENINSGIDKGSPNKQLEPPLWLSNAFGSFKEEIKEHNFDQRRLCFYSNLSSFLSRNGYFQNPNWEEIRNFVLKEIKNWYSHLLSDSRFPVNDVSLFDQAYMTASMFKAVLSQLVVDSSRLNIDDDNKNYLKNPSSIKWRILGIQYDKVGVAEKSLKLASISWYREITDKIDEEIKNLLEVEYPIGNEIYRDETGIYFIVGEDLGKDLNDGSNLAKLKKDLREIEDKILEKFKDLTNDEFYPAIFLTKASRGLMNLSTLLENAKENFLKANWEKKSISLNIENRDKGKAIGICPICQIRLIYEKDKEKKNNPTICEVCDDRIHHKQVSKWIDNLTGETIWIEEIKDKNERVAYISLKFELEDWLNGNLLNSLLIQKSDFKLYLTEIKNFLEIFILNRTNFSDIFSELNKQIRSLEEKLKGSSLNQEEKRKLGQEKGLVESKRRKLSKIENIINKLIEEKWWIKPLDTKYSIEGYSNWDIDTYIQETNNFLSEVNFNLKVKNSFLELSKDAYNGCKNNKESLNDFIKQIFFGSIIGTPWEKLIKTTFLNSKIDWEKEEIRWEKFKDKNDPALDLLATLLLQFLLRKNPSPARLRRIWETTREFFEEIHKKLEQILDIPNWKKKRLVWEIQDNSLVGQKSMELEADKILFWMDKKGNSWEEKINSNVAKIYLISSISNFIDVYGNNQLKELKYKSLKNEKKAIEDLNKIFSSEESLKKHLQKKEIVLKKYGTKEELIKLSIKSNLKKIHSYKPFTSITDPSPINYQVVIPAEYLPKLIDEVIKKYNEEFKYVYGKLPIHIGIVISDYKKPVYINLKALRRIRRDVKDIDNLYRNKNQKDFQKYFRHKTIFYGEEEAKEKERRNQTKSYYSLYWDKFKEGNYNFYIKPSLKLNKDCSLKWKKWLVSVGKLKNKFKTIQIIPNTFDFEYLDHNIRRNEIFYDENGKRLIPLKQNRPYEIEVYWGKFKKFKVLFDKTDLNTTRIHKLIELLYSKLQAEKEYNSDYSYLLTSAFIELLELNKIGKNYVQRRKIINDIFELEINNFVELSNDFRKNLQKSLTKKENILLFLDMFEFWHTAMKEV